MSGNFRASSSDVQNRPVRGTFQPQNPTQFLPKIASCISGNIQESRRTTEQLRKEILSHVPRMCRRVRPIANRQNRVSEDATNTIAGNVCWGAPTRDLYGTSGPAKRWAGVSIPCLPVRMKSSPGSLRAEPSSGAKRPCRLYLTKYRLIVTDPRAGGGTVGRSAFVARRCKSRESRVFVALGASAGIAPGVLRVVPPCIASASHKRRNGSNSISS